MKKEMLPLQDAFLIHLRPHSDERGDFCRLYCEREIGMESVQVNLSTNAKRGTLRGMHYQKSPYEEAKIVHCLRGSVFDVIIDVRPFSPTFLQHFSITLHGQIALYIPPGFAHGFLSLEDETHLLYFMSTYYIEGAAGGYLWNDPAFQIEWPFPPVLLSERDKHHPKFEVPDAMPLL
ncbi:MAG: dTDP-4-dehydrorhamnose 3,5-epimerase family protein [Chlamydiales bacterium]